MNCGSNTIILNTDHLNPPEFRNSLIDNRRNTYSLFESNDTPTASIVVLGYNRLQKTKYCVECILKYTVDISYELILIDNGSDDGTYEYFQSVLHDKKIIIHVTKNIGISFPLRSVKNIYTGKYLIFLSNDIYVTTNWLKNLLTCLESDPQIGFVMPVSNNVSNLQEVDLGFQSFEDMQTKAAKFNKSDPSKWEERMRLITVVSIYKREIIDLVGDNDCGFVHDFIEDDIAMRIRRAGYKMVLCKDTFICHDHDFRHIEDKNAAQFQKSLISGRNNFLEKYHGIEPWDDICNFETGLIQMLSMENFRSAHIVNGLCINVRCGTPILEIKNSFRRHKMKNKLEIHAFTTNAKYFYDLQTVAETVSCDRLDYLEEYYSQESMDVILLGEPINLLPNPIIVLRKLLNLLRKKGQLIFKLKNVYDIQNFLVTLGFQECNDLENPSHLTCSELNNLFKSWKIGNAQNMAEHHVFSKQEMDMIQNIIQNLHVENMEVLKSQLLVKDYLYRIIN